MPLAKLISRLIWLCMLPLLLTSILLSILITRSVQAERERTASNLARNFATHIDYHMSARIAALNMLAMSPLLDDVSLRAGLYSEATRYRASFGSHVILSSAGQPPRMLFNTRVSLGEDLPELPQPAGHSAAQSAIETGRPSMGDVFVGPIAKEPMVAIAVPVVRDSAVRFILLALIEARQLQERVDLVALPPGWTIMVLDGRGEVIAMKSQPDDAPASEGAEAVRFTAAPTVAPWSVQIEIPGYVYRSSLLTAIVAVSVGILVATLAGLAGGRIAARRLSRSVAALTEPSTAGSPASKILEIDAARRVLEESRLKREASEEELKASQTLLRRYTAHLQETIETERLRIARELHDDLGQRLSALKMDLGWVKRRVPPDPPSLTGKLDEMAASLSEVVGTTRRICADLRPGVLDDLGLGAALEVLVSEFRRRQDVEVSLRTDAGVPVSEKLLGAAIYRIVQEALTNALRHSGASEADVWLRHERERLVLSVTDNGRGLSPDAETHPQSFGIIGMRERVNSLGGTFELASGPRGGTRLVASFPISSKEH